MPGALGAGEARFAAGRAGGAERAGASAVIHRGPPSSAVRPAVRRMVTRPACSPPR